MKIGDKVRFLSEVGGGRVAGFQGKDIVLVEDEDGFDVPMRISEVVVIGEENYDTGHVVEMKQRGTKAADDVEVEPADKPVNFTPMPQERKGGEQLSAYLAFVPIDVKDLTHTRFETFFVNDSNYFIRFAYLSAEGAGWKLRHTAEVEPNTKLFLEEFGREDLQELDRVGVQLVAYKRGKNFMLKPAVDVQLRIDAVKFYKLHTFHPTMFFEQPALIYTIVESDKPARPLVVDPQQLRKAFGSAAEPSSSQAKPSAPILRYDEKGDGTLVVDLHADALLDNQQGLTGIDILNYQLDTLRKVLTEHKKDKGLKIVFIHGKGDGVLRRAIINELHYRYKQYTYQDASFQEYGYGATQVTIR